MNLNEAVAMAELAAGGPGSGCHGPGCGRHGHSSFDRMMKRRMKEWAQNPHPKSPTLDYSHTGHPLHHLHLAFHRAITEWAKTAPHKLVHSVMKLVDYDPEAMMHFVELVHHTAEQLAPHVEPALAMLPRIPGITGEKEGK